MGLGLELELELELGLGPGLGQACLRELRRGDDDGEALRAREGNVEAVGVEHEGHTVGAAAGDRGGGRVVIEVGVGEGDYRDRRLLALEAVRSST